MANWLSRALSENGEPSTMRLMSLACCFVALAVWIYSVMTQKPADLPTIITILGFGFGGKLIQKTQEAKTPSQPLQTGP